MLHFCKCRLEHTVVFMFWVCRREKKTPRTETPVLYHLIGLDTLSINITPWRQGGKIS